MDILNPTFQVECEFNTHAKISLVIEYRMLSITPDLVTGGLMDKEKFRILKVLDKKEVPYAFIQSASLRKSPQYEVLFRALEGDPDSTDWVIPPNNLGRLLPFLEDSHYGAIGQSAAVFEMIFGALNDNRYNYGIAYGLASDEKGVLIRPLISNGAYVETIENGYGKVEFDGTIKAINQWKRLTGIGELRKFFSTPLKKKIKVVLQGWTSYIERNLFNRRDSLLYREPNEEIVKGRPSYSIENCIIRVANVDDITMNWADILAEYRLRNPNGPGGPAEVSLTSLRPADTQITDRKCISFVAFDKRENRMLGYASYSLHSTIFYQERDDFYDAPELNTLNRTVRDNVRLKKFQGMGFDTFALDGIHLDSNYRGGVIKEGVTLSKLLVFCAMEFIRLTQDELGVKMVMAYSKAIQTRIILVNTFKFGHYNKQQDGLWICGHLLEYMLILNGQSKSGERTSPPNLLSFSSARARFQNYKTSILEPDRQRYSKKATQNDTRKNIRRNCRNKVQGVGSYDERLRLIGKCLSKIDAILEKYDEDSVKKGVAEMPKLKKNFLENREQRKPKRMTMEQAETWERGNYLPKRQFVSLDKSVKKFRDSLLDPTPEESVKYETESAFIGVGFDVDDTFMILPSELFNQRISEFNQLVVKPKPVDVVVDNNTEKEKDIIIILDDMDVNTLDIQIINTPISIYAERRRREERVGEPTEEDLVLHEMVQEIYSKQIIEIRDTEESSSESIVEEVVEEEEEEEDEEMVNLQKKMEKYKSRIKKREEKISLLRKELGEIRGNEIHFSKLLLTQS